MLRQFNSNARKLNRAIKQINLNNLSGSGYLDNLIDDYKLQSSLSASFDGRDENGDPLSQEQAMLELSASIAYNYNTSFDTTISTKFNSNVRSNPNPIKLVNNKGRIHDFHTEILEYSALYIKLPVNDWDSNTSTLTIRNAKLAYGTEQPSPENFEVFINGIHLPGIYNINQVENDVVVTIYDNITSLGAPVLDFSILSKSSIWVIGKLLEIS